ncbi:MAG: hypothetical protein LBQ24_07315 [Candidatus Peribacteria bacterium]|nr:hypothetical protein [Candidatus Peribacteria bacterium]
MKEIEEVEKKESEMKEKVEKLKSSIHDLMSKLDNYSKEKLENIALIIKR